MASTTTLGPPAEAAGRRRGATLTVLCIGMFLVLLDVTVVNVALPGIGRALGTDLPGLQGVVDGYAVAIAGLLLGGGALGDRLGHRRMVLLGLAVFGIASLGCGLAPGPEALIVARAVQGAGAALLLPGTLAAVTAIYPERAEQARALGRWAAISSLALPAGPLLGGLLVDSVGWRWIFLINGPIVAAAAIAVAALVPAPPPRPRSERRPLDPAGLVLAPVTLGAAVWAVIAAGHGDRRSAAIFAAVAAAALAAFVAAERRARAPMLPGGLLRTPAFAGANGIALVMNLVTNGTLLVSTLYLQQVRGWQALPAGLMLLPMAVPLAALAPLSGRLTARYGTRVPVTAGVLFAAPGSFGLLLVGPDGPAAELLPVLLGLGVGNGLLVTAVVAAAMRAVPTRHAGLAGGFNNTARQIGTAMGVAVYGAIAGPPLKTAAFAAGLHVLAWLGPALWALAFGLSRLVPRPERAR